MPAWLQKEVYKAETRFRVTDTWSTDELMTVLKDTLTLNERTSRTQEQSRNERGEQKQKIAQGSAPQRNAYRGAQKPEATDLTD